ncbi:MAG: hypothetical protein NVSMB9_19860 [Isosphaeraceae bacterium]
MQARAGSISSDAQRDGAVFVHLLPSLIPPGALRGGVAVVVDVLRATTVMIQALAVGCEAIIPCGEIDEARGVASGLPAGSALLAGERQGIPIDGFDLGNSLNTFTAAVCRGKTLVMTTTNGTRAILASLEAERVLVAAFSNLRATVSFLREQEREVHVVCSGTDGRISLEDSLLAGAIATGLHEGWTRGNDEAEIVSELWRKVKSEAVTGDEDFDEQAFELLLTVHLGRGRGGRRVRELGLQADIRAAARLDQHSFVAELWPDSRRIVRG